MQTARRTRRVVVPKGEADHDGIREVESWGRGSQDALPVHFR